MSVENNALNWVSISSGGALDMTHCHFSVRSARDEMRHIIGSSEPLGLTRIRKVVVERRTRITQNFCVSCMKRSLRARTPNVRARWVAKELQDAREARVARVDAATGGAESSVVGDRQG